MTVIFSLLKWSAFSSQVNLPGISSECNSVIWDLSPANLPVENGAPFHRRMPKPVYISYSVRQFVGCKNIFENFENHSFQI